MYVNDAKYLGKQKSYAIEIINNVWIKFMSCMDYLRSMINDAGLGFSHETLSIFFYGSHLVFLYPCIIKGLKFL